MSNLKIGDVIKSIRGNGVTYPFTEFSYRVVKIEDGKITLEIV